MTQHPYTYTILRYLHDPRAGEALNVGVVLHVAAERTLLARVRSTFGRVKAAFPDLDGEAFKQALREVERGIERVAREMQRGGLLAAAGDAAAFARRAMPEDDSALQWSPVGSGLTADAEATLERLYDRFVQRHDDRARRRRDDEDIWRPVRERLEARGVSVPFEEKTFAGEVDAITFRHAWKNGQWHAYEGVSLDLASQDSIMEKARRWVGHLTTVKDGLAEPLKLHLIIGAPQEQGLGEAYRKALTMMRKAPLGPEVVEEDAIDDLVSRIEDEVRAHAQDRGHPAALGG
ncbi:MAG: DUF3037 domain-containing protein [Acetobacteraceae bacterium]|uniref:DUF3037 domain-containing protein n=1 Tax=Crenalkalicoccus roseus TaxID=1485588 RepID=UPI001305268D|nr:DUF3037 domain-containing protein [Crenalkalicoccus roseus]MBX6745222.1 DUF3037 domain-containing protein [Acetobacteraceae bacterium]MDI3309270.1 DUF3037 domain-containing protein [Acetobacteraceae bacterium]